MFESLRIRNYRVFKDLEIRGLKRINLIGGRNNSGKTTLLEAICLLVSHKNPQVAISSHVVRSPSPVDEPTTTPLSVETTWKHLFHGADTARPIKIDGALTSGLEVSLKIAAQRKRITQIALGSGLNGGGPEARSLVFHYSDSKKREAESSISVSASGIEIEQPEPDKLGDSSDAVQGARIVLPQLGSRSEDAAHLANLRVHKQSDMLLKTLQLIEPRLQSIEDSVASGNPMIWGDVGLSEMIPLHVMGEGMTHVSRIMLGIYSMPGGVVLIDEIENGIHHSVMPDVWKAIGKAAERFDVQIFATTHSFECFVAARDGLGACGFTYFRPGTSRKGDDEAVMYDSETIDAAIRHRIEVR